MNNAKIKVSIEVYSGLNQIAGKMIVTGGEFTLRGAAREMEKLVTEAQSSCESQIEKMIENESQSQLVLN